MRQQVDRHPAVTQHKFSVDRSDEGGSQRRYAILNDGTDYLGALKDAYRGYGDAETAEQLGDALKGYGGIFMPSNGEDVVYVVRYVHGMV